MKAADMVWMTTRWLCCVCIATIALAAAGMFDTAAGASGPVGSSLYPHVEVGEVPAIKLEPQPPPGKEQAAHILKLIGNLAKINDPDFGRRFGYGEDSFAPIPAAPNGALFIQAGRQSNICEDFADLVKIGPKALPFLLAALDDQTPTKIVERNGFGVMWFADSLSGNPGHASEQKVLGSLPQLQKREGADGSLNSYTIKVGDVCFVVIGQIVGRAYQAVQYVPTACMEIHSPTHDPNLARQVREIWSSPEPAQHLLDSLLVDYASREVAMKTTGESVFLDSDLQCSAARRLLYYFPQQTANLIAAHLHQLDLGKYDTYLHVSNEMWANELFIGAVGWSQEPAVRAELVRIFGMTGDPAILGSAGLAMKAANPAAYRTRVEQFIAALPETENLPGGSLGEGYKFLSALGWQMGTQARPAFEMYMKNASLQRLNTMCRLLGVMRGEWSVDFLAPYLEDTRTVVSRGDLVAPGLPIRVCDEAAATIAKNFPKLSFKMAGPNEDLDHQIQKMRAQIAHHDY